MRLILIPRESLSMTRVDRRNALALTQGETVLRDSRYAYTDFVLQAPSQAGVNPQPA